MKETVEKFLDGNFEKAVHFKSSDGMITYSCSYENWGVMFGEVIESAIDQGLTPSEIKEEILKHDIKMNYGWSQIIQASTDKNGNIE